MLAPSFERLDLFKSFTECASDDILIFTLVWLHLNPVFLNVWDNFSVNWNCYFIFFFSIWIF